MKFKTAGDLNQYFMGQPPRSLCVYVDEKVMYEWLINNMFVEIKGEKYRVHFKPMTNSVYSATLNYFGAEI